MSISTSITVGEARRLTVDEMERVMSIYAPAPTFYSYDPAGSVVIPLEAGAWRWAAPTTSGSWYTSSSGETTVTWIESPADLQWQQEYIRPAREIAEIYAITPQEIGLTSTTNYTSASWPTIPSGYGFSYTPEPEVDEYERAMTAKEELTALMTRFPKALPVVKRAIENGYIDGRGYGKHWGRTSYNELSCCIVGWIMRATRRRDPKFITREPFSSTPLERYVYGIRAGETHETNFRLSVLHWVLEHLEQAAEETVEVLPVTEEEARLGIERLLRDIQFDEPELVSV